MSEEKRKQAKKNISRSARNDYRNYVETIVQDIEDANKVGKYSDTFKLAKQLSGKKKSSSCVQPSKDNEGNPIISTEKQLELWAEFLEKKFEKGPEEPEVNLEDPDEEAVPPPTLDETVTCLKKLSRGKAAGPDEIPIEQYQSSDSACRELHNLLVLIFETEQVPEDLVTGDMLMLYKKNERNKRTNYRALGLLNHSYKTFSMVLLVRIVPFIDPLFSDMQAGFHAGRGCRDNILILTMAIYHLLSRVEADQCAGIITYIDFVAAFDSIYHSYMLESMKRYGVPLKYIRLVAEIYKNASVRVRLQEKGGHRSYSRNIPIRRGAIQGDIPSPVVFLIALDRLLKEHGSLHTGIRITEQLTLSELAFADDAALGNQNTQDASQRITRLSEGAKEAGMEISVPKTKVQHIAHRPKVTATTEEDIANLPTAKKFQYECESCGMTYPTKHGRSVHQGRFCKGPNSKKPSRKGTVADRIITRMKVEEHQNSLPKVMMGDKELDNTYAMVYLGAEVAGDGDQQVTFKHRRDIAWGKFNEYRTPLTTSKLSINLRIRLYSALVVQTMIYGSSAWLLDTKLKKNLNGVSSKMLTSITKRSIHEEASSPTFDIVDHVLKRRKSYLGHILRLDPERGVRRYLLELNPDTTPFVPGSLLADTSFETVEDMIEAAQDRLEWAKD